MLELSAPIRKKAGYYYVPAKADKIDCVWQFSYDNPLHIIIKSKDAEDEIKIMEKDAIQSFIKINNQYFSNTFTDKDIKDRYRSPLVGNVLSIDGQYSVSKGVYEGSIRLFGLRIFEHYIEPRWKIVSLEEQDMPPANAGGTSDVVDIGVDQDDRKELLSTWEKRVQNVHDKYNIMIANITENLQKLDSMVEAARDKLQVADEYNDAMEKLIHFLEPLEQGVLQ